MNAIKDTLTETEMSNILMFILCDAELKSVKQVRYFIRNYISQKRKEPTDDKRKAYAVRNRITPSM